MPHVDSIRRGEMPKAAEWNAMAQAFNYGAIGLGANAVRRLPVGLPIVTVKNDSGADRSRFDCMSLGAPIEALADDGSVDLIFLADVADADEVPIILLEPIANELYGKAILHGLALAKVGGGTGTFATPDATNHRLAPATTGMIKLLATPHATDPKLLPVLIGGGGSGDDNCILIKTPGGGIPAASGSGPYTFGSATCTVVSDAGVVGSSTVTVKNIVNQAIAANVVGKAERYGSIWVIDVASCG